jgi:tetratricopeptide (TPR) repeat protein
MITPVLLAAGLLCGGPVAQQTPATEAAAESPAAANLLDLAFQAHADMPLVPHVKNRSRGQHRVVEAALALGMPERAIGYSEQIANWRRALGLADASLHFARSGDPRAAALMTRAQEALAASTGPDSQAWHRSRVLSRIAAARYLLGETEAALEMGAGVSAEERLPLVEAEMATLDAADFDSRIEGALAVVGTGSFDLVHQALVACTRLHGRFYEDAELRRRAAETVTGSWKGLPPMMRLELLLRLAEGAVEHGDGEGAVPYLDQAVDLRAAFQWRPNHFVALSAQIAELRARAGQSERAGDEVAAALEIFQSERDRIVDIDRADALVPLAEAELARGDRDGAARLYALALEEGFHNPNSRPRLDDLTAILCSMATQGFEPDEEMMKELRIRAGSLGAPW